jgi:tetratricopeptide (TPR) repeat protein
LGHGSTGEAHLAINFYQQALAIDAEINDYRGEATDLDNLGQEYRKLDDLDKAVECFTKALDINRKIQDPIRRQC